MNKTEREQKEKEELDGPKQPSDLSLREDRVADLYRLALELKRRAETTADRVYGQQSQSDEVDVSTEIPTGSIRRLDLQIDLLATTMAQALDQIGRLSEL